MQHQTIDMMCYGLLIVTEKQKVISYLYMEKVNYYKHIIVE